MKQRYNSNDVPGDLLGNASTYNYTLVEAVEDYVKRMRRYPKVIDGCGADCQAPWCKASQLEKLTAIAVVRRRRRR